MELKLIRKESGGRLTLLSKRLTEEEYRAQLDPIFASDAERMVS